MLKSNGKITTRQVFILGLIAVLSPTIRVMPIACSAYAGQAGWIAPIISVVSLIILYSVIKAFFKKTKIQNLNDVFDAALGNVIGKIVVTLYLIWCLFLFSSYLRHYAVRLTATIFPTTDIRFFIVVMLAIIYISARGRIEVFCRFSEFSFFFFVAVMIFLLLFMLPEIDLKNIYPVTYYDILPASRASLVVSAIWGYLFLPFFFGEYINDKDQIKKNGKKATIFLGAMTTLILTSIIGTIGPSVAQRMSFPFFCAVKLITFIESFDRFETFMLAIWVVADFVLLTFLAVVIINIIKTLFSFSETRFLATPVLSIGYIGSQYIAMNTFELETLSIGFIINVNLIMLYIIPIITLIVGKLRKKL